MINRMLADSIGFLNAFFALFFGLLGDAMIAGYAQNFGQWLLGSIAVSLVIIGWFGLLAVLVEIRRELIAIRQRSTPV